MKTAASLFDDHARTRIAEAVRTAEARTSAEIVPVVASSSDRYDRAADQVAAGSALGALWLAWILFQREDPAAGGWDGLPLTLSLPVLLIILIVGGLVGLVAASHLPWLKRLCIPRSLMVDSVESRATEMFFDGRIHHTNAATGILVFVSVFERRAVIIADKAAHRALGEPMITSVCQTLTADLHGGDITGALINCCSRLGDELASSLPRGDSDEAELADALITVD